MSKRITAGGVALILSLGVNLLVAGVLAGALLRGDDAPLRVAVTPDLRSAISALPEAGRDQVRAALRDSAARSETRAERLRRARDFARAVRAEPMDRAALEAILNARAASGDAVRAAAQGALLDTLEAMSAAERAEFLDNIGRGDRPRGPGTGGPERPREGRLPPG